MITASWYSKLPDTYQVIGISRSSPRGMAKGYRLYKKLAPGPWFKTASDEEYAALYFGEVLANLDPAQVLADLINMSDGKIPALVCYEKPGVDGWCHRGMVSVWLHQQLGIEVAEYGHDGFGLQHIMLPNRGA